MKGMTNGRSGRSFQAFPDLDGRTLKHRRVVRLKSLRPWTLSTLIAALTHFHGAGEWNENHNDRAFLMVGMPA
jgi:hypothetical protein